MWVIMARLGTVGTRRTSEDRSDRTAADRRRLDAAVTRQRPNQRHCWVRMPDDTAAPGLLIAWTRTPTGWSAQVACVTAADELVVKTVPAEDLRPAQHL